MSLDPRYVAGETMVGQAMNFLRLALLRAAEKGVTFDLAVISGGGPDGVDELVINRIAFDGEDVFNVEDDDGEPGE